jgi:acyl-coenzyme A thioesterase PaaI-like protein
MPLVHHELCFGCGRTNLFGLLLEVERTGPDTVAGRCFIKQDHQGADRGSAHQGIVATALEEAMALACGREARAETFTVEFTGSAPVGAFLDVEARVDERAGKSQTAAATASVEGRVVAQGHGAYR